MQGEKTIDHTCSTERLAAPARETFTVTGWTSAEAAKARILSGMVAENITVCLCALKYDIISLRSSSKPVSTCKITLPEMQAMCC